MARVERRVSFVPDVHAPQVLARVRELDPDLGLIYGGPILKPELFDIPRFGTLGIHHGRLPEYRGRKTTFWEMQRGEETAGVTIQRINAGVDTGEVLQRGAVPIGGKTYGRVWREVQQLGVELYLDAVLQVKRGAATFESPAPSKGPHYRDPRSLDILRLWWRRLA
jgi:methionyl-tRNA formyltransferase